MKAEIVDEGECIVLEEDINYLNALYNYIKEKHPHILDELDKEL